MALSLFYQSTSHDRNLLSYFLLISIFSINIFSFEVYHFVSHSFWFVFTKSSFRFLFLSFPLSSFSTLSNVCNNDRYLPVRCIGILMWIIGSGFFLHTSFNRLVRTMQEPVFDFRFVSFAIRRITPFCCAFIFISTRILSRYSFRFAKNRFGWSNHLIVAKRNRLQFKVVPELIEVTGLELVTNSFLFCFVSLSVTLSRFRSLEVSILNELPIFTKFTQTDQIKCFLSSAEREWVGSFFFFCLLCQTIDIPYQLLSHFPSRLIFTTKNQIVFGYF